MNKEEYNLARKIKSGKFDKYFYLEIRCSRSDCLPDLFDPRVWGVLMNDIFSRWPFFTVAYYEIYKDGDEIRESGWEWYENRDKVDITDCKYGKAGSIGAAIGAAWLASFEGKL